MDKKKDNICQHDINCLDNSVILSKQRFFTIPNEVYGVCEVCGASLTYLKSTQYILQEGKDNEKSSDILSN